jgi:hypothetical protein
MNPLGEYKMKLSQKIKTSWGKGNRPSMIVLEPRMLFDGAPIVDPTSVSTTSDAVHVSVDLAVTDSPVIDASVSSTSVDNGVVDTSGVATISAPIELMFIDPSTENVEQLISAIRSNIDIFVIDNSSDPWIQMSQVIAENSNISAIHIVSHGSDGRIILAGQDYERSDLQARADILSGWKTSLNLGADILIYGCDIAQTSVGQAFVHEFSSITGADIAASSDVTGLTQNGSNWTLETSSGVIETSSAFDQDAILNYQGSLAAGTVSLSSIYAGSPITITVTDADLNSSNSSAQTTTVTVLNVRSGESELVTLTETGVNTGIFTNTLTTASSASVGTNNSGSLNLIAGDQIRATYVDASPSATLTDSKYVNIPGTFSATTGINVDTTGVTSGLIGAGKLITFDPVTITNTGANSVQLVLRAYDVDYGLKNSSGVPYPIGNASSEWDGVYIAKVADAVTSAAGVITAAPTWTFLGYLNGTNNTWNYTTLDIAAYVRANGTGKYSIRVVPDDNGTQTQGNNGGRWVVGVSSAQVLVDGGAAVGATLSGLAETGQAVVSSVTPKIAGNYTVEYNLYDSTGRDVAALSVAANNLLANASVTVSGTMVINSNFYSSWSLLPTGTYNLVATLIDATGTVQDTKSTSVSLVQNGSTTATTYKVKITDLVQWYGTSAADVAHIATAEPSGSTTVVLKGTLASSARSSGSYVKVFEVINGVRSSTPLNNSVNSGKVTLSSGATTYSIALPNALTNGTHYYQVYYYRSSSSSGYSNIYSLVVDTPYSTAPVITQAIDNFGGVVGNVASAGSTDDITPLLSGTSGGPNTTLNIYDAATVNGVTTTSALGVAVADASGNWIFDVPEYLNLKTGAHVFTAKDMTNNVTSATYTLNITSPTPQQSITILALSNDTGVSQADFITSTQTQTITASLDSALSAGQTLWGSLDKGVTWSNITDSVSGTSIAWAGQSLKTGYANSAQYEPYAIQFKIGNGSVYGAVASQDYQLLLSNGAAVISTMDALGSTSVTTNRSYPVISGTAEVGTLVDIYFGLTKQATVAVDPSGLWTWLPSSAISNGTYYVKAIERNELTGYTAAASPVKTLVVNTSLPLLVLNAASDSGVYNNDEITSAQTPSVRVNFSSIGFTPSGGVDTIKFYLDGVQLGSAATISVAEASAGYKDVTLSSLGGDGIKNITAQVVHGSSIYTSNLLDIVLDRTAPIFSRAVVDGDSVTLTYAETVGLSIDPPSLADFTYKVNGGSSTAPTSLEYDTVNKTVILNLASAVGSGDTVVISYGISGSGTTIIKDLAGNSAIALTGQSVTNNTDLSAPTLVSIVRQNPTAATSNADTVTFRVTFADNGSNAVVNVDPTDFKALLGGNAVSVSSVTKYIDPATNVESNLIYDVVVDDVAIKDANGALSLGIQTASGGMDITDASAAANSLADTATTASYTLDNTAPSITPTITSIKDGSITISNSGTTADKSPDIYGSITTALGGGDVVNIFRDGLYIGNATMLTTTTWKYSDGVNTPLVSGGTYAYTACVTDSLGNSTALTSNYSISVVGLNEAPILAATNATVTYISDMSLLSLFTGASVSAIELNQSIESLTFTMSNVSYGDVIKIDGTEIALSGLTTSNPLSSGSSPTSVNGMAYNITIDSSSLATFTISKAGGVSSSRIEALINNLQFQNTLNVAGAAHDTRMVTLTSLKDTGGTSGGGVDTSAVSISTTVKIDDNDGIVGTREDALANKVSTLGDLNGDGIADSVQSAVTTFAWKDSSEFGTVINSVANSSVVSLIAGSSISTPNDARYQITDVQVGANAAQISGVATTWSTLDFVVSAKGSGSLLDSNLVRAGTQVKVIFSVSSANWSTSTVNQFYVQVTDQTIANYAGAGITLYDLSGAQIINGGWYNFTKSSGTGDGALFVDSNADGKWDAIEVTYTDNAFGDKNVTVGIIDDPVQLGATSAAPTITANSTYLVIEDVASDLIFSGNAVSNPSGNPTTVTFSVPQGEISGASSTVISIGGSATARTFTGTITDLNAYFLVVGNVKYTTASNDVTSQTLTITAVDSTNSGSTATTTATINVSAVNDAPSVTISQSSYSATEQIDKALQGTGISIADIDAGSSDVTVNLALTSASANFGILEVAKGTNVVTVSGSGTNSVTLTGTLTQINALLAGSNGATVTYKADSDIPAASVLMTVGIDDGGNTGIGGAKSSSTSVTISVTAVNDAPVAVNDSSLTATENSAIIYTSAQLLGNDIDADGNTLTISSVTNGAGGVAVLNGDGTVTFTPTTNFNGAASFTYKATDGVAESNSATASITVAAVNHSPVAVNDSLTTPEDTAVTYTAAQLLGNDTDVDGNTLTISSVTNVTGGTVVLNGDGTVTFTPTANFNGAASFSYKATDGVAESNLATVSITVAAINDPPVAINDSLTATQDIPVTYSAVQLLGNDTDVDGNALTISSVTGVTGGAVVLNSDGTVTFTPSSNFTGSASFTYVVQDGGGATSSSATVTVNVVPVSTAAAAGGPETYPTFYPQIILPSNFAPQELEFEPAAIADLTGDVDDWGRPIKGSQPTIRFNGGQAQKAQFIKASLANTSLNGVVPMVVASPQSPELAIQKPATEAQSGLRNTLTPPDAVPTSSGQLTYELPRGTFSGGHGAVALMATQKDGSPLPAWVKFDSSTGKMVADVPKSLQSPIEIKIQATDSKGDKAETTLKIKPLPGRQQSFIGKPPLSAQIESIVRLVA